ncbi:MAG: hypothetical protein SFY69_03760 [Planctomycetota bacterium]|nr:hypothetical protein [Planctomycetota bacterium]
MTRALRFAAVLAVIVLCAPRARAWDAHGHRLITRLALEGMRTVLGEAMPGWLADAKATAMVADQSNTPDRWRSVRVPQLKHLNDPDHYMDIEQLAEFGLSLRTIPPLRHEYVRVMSVAREQPGFTGKPANPRLDPARVQEYPGFLPHATLENYAKVVSAFKVVRILERLNDPARAHQLEMARASALYSMGVLSHYVGDAAQPLHTTVHYNGWTGPNPKGYTTDKGIHSYIDGGVIALHRISIDDVRPLAKFDLDAADPWETILAHLERSHAQMEPLYAMHKAGGLEKDEGKAFIEARLADGSRTLAAFYARAWRESEPSRKDIDDFVRYDGFHKGE